jgi:hypothetical protein
MRLPEAANEVPVTDRTRYRLDPFTPVDTVRTLTAWLDDHAPTNGKDGDDAQTLGAGGRFVPAATGRVRGVPAGGPTPHARNVVIARGRKKVSGGGRSHNWTRGREDISRSVACVRGDRTFSGTSMS